MKLGRPFTAVSQILYPTQLSCPSVRLHFSVLNVPYYIITSSPFYSFPPSNSVVDARIQLQELGTDYLWRCSAWTFARNWVQNGGTAYVGKYLIGATYPSNQEVPYCTQPGIVCHQDDIEIVVRTHVTLCNFPSSTNQFSLLVWNCV